MKYLLVFFLSAILIATGWFGRAILDDSLIKRDVATALTVAAVELAIKNKEERDAQEPKIAQSIATVRSAAKIIPSISCPPGSGAMSDSAADSLRDAFKTTRD